MPNISKRAFDEIIPELDAVQAAEYVFVEIPDRDLTDYSFAGIGINFLHFGGPAELKCDCLSYPDCTRTKRHKVTPELAAEIQERLTLARAADLRIYTNRRDMKALVQLVKNNPNYNYFDPNTPSVER